MLVLRSQRSQAAVIALTEGTSHPGSRSDPNLLKICAEGKNALKEQCQRPGLCQVWLDGNLVSGRHVIPLSDVWGEMSLRIIYCKVHPGYRQTWCLYSLLNRRFLAKLLTKSISALHTCLNTISA